MKFLTKGTVVEMKDQTIGVIMGEMEGGYRILADRDNGRGPVLYREPVDEVREYSGDVSERVKEAYRNLTGLQTEIEKQKVV